MVETKIIWSSGITALITALIVLGGVKFTDTNTFGCEVTGIFMECSKLTAYYGLPNGKCINAKVGNKLCRSGWTKDFKVIDEELSPNNCQPFIIAYTDNGKYFCDKIGIDANCIKDDTLELPIV